MTETGLNHRIREKCGGIRVRLSFILLSFAITTPHRKIELRRATDSSMREDRRLPGSSFAETLGGRCRLGRNHSDLLEPQFVWEDPGLGGGHDPAGRRGPDMSQNGTAEAFGRGDTA